MKRIHLIYPALLLLAAAACSENAADAPDMGGREIRLAASVGDIQAGSRATADYFEEGDPLKAAVWFRKAGGGYDETPAEGDTTYLPAHTNVEFNGLTPVLYGTDNLKYPADNSKVYCVGMYPATGWTQSDDKKIISHPINGEDDLMFAKEIEGSWDNHFPAQDYKHLLTWIKINICASSHDAIEEWGTIKQITINSDSIVTVNLETGEKLYEGHNGEDIQRKTIPIDSEPITLSTTNNEVGSVFCSPKTKYTVKVTSINKNGEEITKSVDMTLNIITTTVTDGQYIDEITTVTDPAEAIGRCFVFSLYFTPYSVISGVTTLNSWDNQNEDIYLD